MVTKVFVFIPFSLYPAHVTYLTQGLCCSMTRTVSLMSNAWLDIPRLPSPLRINRNTWWCACLWQMRPQQPKRRPSEASVSSKTLTPLMPTLAWSSQGPLYSSISSIGLCTAELPCKGIVVVAYYTAYISTKVKENSFLPLIESKETTWCDAGRIRIQHKCPGIDLEDMYKHLSDVGYSRAKDALGLKEIAEPQHHTVYCLIRPSLTITLMRL